MSLSCSCEYDWDFDAGEWMYCPASTPDFEPLQTSKRKRCCSCKELIDIGSLCIVQPRRRYPHDDIEARIKTGLYLEDAMNDEPPIRVADHYQCERCGEIWLNLLSLGFECLVPNENMAEALAEYHELSGFERKSA